MDQPEKQQIDALRERVRLLEAEKADLEMLLETSTGHYDEIERELLTRIKETIESSGAEIAALNEKIRHLESQKADLEVIMETSTDHSDEIEQELRERVRATIAASERRFRLITETIPVPILVSRRADGIIVYSNEHAARLFGIGVDALLDHRVTELFEPSDRDALLALIDKEGFLGNRELKGSRLDGSTFWAELTVQPFTYNDEPCLLSVWRDITERRALEGQLRQTHKMEAIGTFASGIAHDFNNILAAIFGFTETGIDELPENHPVREQLQKVLVAAHRAKDLVMQILTFAHQSDLEMKPLRLSPIILETMQLIKQITTAHIQIHLDIKSQDAWIIGDPIQIHQLLMNLCSNAVDAMRETGGNLEVVLEEVEGRDAGFPRIEGLDEAARFARLSVSDTGHGIKKEILDTIFDPFFTTKETTKGTGMGLSVVHGIVKSHGGAISVESEPGRGTTFRICLPLAQGAEEDGTDATEPSAVDLSGSETVLLVDDEVSILEFFPRMLAKLGYTVCSQEGSLEALELFKTDPLRFDLVITDDMMPKLRGRILAKEMKAVRPDIPIILCTGSAKLQRSKDTETDEAIDHVVLKPYTCNEIASVIRTVIKANQDKWKKPLAAPAHLEGRTVLIVEDEELLRGVIPKVLERQGYTCLLADSATAALQICREPQVEIDLLLSDLRMPDMNGQDLWALVHSLKPKAKVVFMSGDTPETILKLSGMGSDTPFIQKPFTAAELGRKLKSVLGR